MRYVLFALLLSLLGPLTVQADDAPHALGPLGGGWSRPHYATVSIEDGDVVSPGLRFIVEGTTRRLSVGGTPPIVYWNPGPKVYDVMGEVGAKEGVLDIVVPDRGLARKVRCEYSLEEDKLFIICKEKIPAGPWLKDYDISGKWVRAKGTYKKQTLLGVGD